MYVLCVYVCLFVFFLSGCTSFWCLFIYGVGSLVVEHFYRRYHATVPILIRGLVYVAWIYVWEFSTGTVVEVTDIDCGVLCVECMLRCMD